jgi:hypothetical protein
MGCGEIAEKKQNLTNGHMGSPEDCRIVLSLGLMQQLYRQFVRRLECPADNIMQVQPEQNVETLRNVVKSFAEDLSTAVDRFHLRSGIAPGDTQRCSQRQLHVEFMFCALGDVRQRLQECEPLCEVTNGFQVGRTLLRCCPAHCQ